MASAELKEAQRAGAELMQDREELSAQLAGLEQQLADMTQAHDDLRCSTTCMLHHCTGRVPCITCKICANACTCSHRAKLRQPRRSFAQCLPSQSRWKHCSSLESTGHLMPMTAMHLTAFIPALRLLPAEVPHFANQCCPFCLTGVIQQAVQRFDYLQAGC